MNWRQLINGALLIRLIILACIIKMGCTLKCYVCDTELNSTCAKINKDTKLRAQECTFEGLNDPLNTLLGKLSYIRLDTRFITARMLERSDENDTQDYLKFECVKIISSDGGGHQTIHRSCQLKQPDYCTIIGNKAWEKNQGSDEPIEIIDCKVCDDKDNCNSASSNRIPIILMTCSIIIISIIF